MSHADDSRSPMLGPYDPEIQVIMVDIAAVVDQFGHSLVIGEYLDKELAIRH